jgi:hypothetical protein
MTAILTSVARAEVRGRSCGRQAFLSMDDAVGCALVEPRGFPRTWHRTNDAVLEGFERGWRDAAGRPAHARLAAAVAGAQGELVRLCRQLIERVPADAHMVALVVDGGTLCGTVVGSGRVYRHDSGRAERVSPRDIRPGGLLDGSPPLFSVSVGRGTLIFAGTESAFCGESVQRSGELLAREPKVSPAVLVSLLTEPAEQSGAGAAVAALRVGA